MDELKPCPFCGGKVLAWYCTFDGKHKAASGTKQIVKPAFFIVTMETLTTSDMM